MVAYKRKWDRFTCRAADPRTDAVAMTRDSAAMMTLSYSGIEVGIAPSLQMGLTQVEKGRMRAHLKQKKQTNIPTAFKKKASFWILLYIAVILGGFDDNTNRSRFPFSSKSKKAAA